MKKIPELDKLIDEFAKNKAEADSYKKICDSENSQIKQLMKDSKITEYETEEYKAVYSVSNRETINEEMLLNIAHAKDIPIIKTKECIDYESLETLIYNGQISKEALLEMDKAKESKEVITLKVTKRKKKREEDE